MTKWLRPIASGLVAIQLVQFPRTNPPVAGELAAPAEVKAILRRACYDCHSNETTWPWYSAVAPASWVIHRDVSEGRRRMNLSSWADYAEDPGTRAQKLDEIRKAVVSGDMAPRYYLALHPRARLSESDRAALLSWVTDELHAGPVSD